MSKSCDHNNSTVLVVKHYIQIYSCLGLYYVFLFSFTENLTPFGNATQSSTYGPYGKPEYAVNPPISNEFNLHRPYCTHTYPYKLNSSVNSSAWWMFNFSFKTAYITDITIYYREGCK